MSFPIQETGRIGTKGQNKESGRDSRQYQTFMSRNSSSSTRKSQLPRRFTVANLNHFKKFSASRSVTASCFYIDKRAVFSNQRIANHSSTNYVQQWLLCPADDNFPKFFYATDRSLVVTSWLFCPWLPIPYHQLPNYTPNMIDSEINDRNASSQENQTVDGVHKKQ